MQWIQILLIILFGSSVNEIEARFNNYRTDEYDDIKEWIVSMI